MTKTMLRAAQIVAALALYGVLPVAVYIGLAQAAVLALRRKA